MNASMLVTVERSQRLRYRRVDCGDIVCSRTGGAQRGVGRKSPIIALMRVHPLSPRRESTARRTACT